MKLVEKNQTAEYAKDAEKRIRIKL